MLEVLVFAAILIAIGQLWSKTGTIDQRLAELERGAAVSSAPFTDLPPARRAPTPPRARRQAYRPQRLDFEVEAPLPAFEARGEHVGEAQAAAAEELRAERAAAPVEPDTGAPQSGGPAFGFEELFGGKLPIWAGGVTLAVAGVLIVRYSIEAGLLSPFVRVLAGLIFGGALIAAAETALRMEGRIRDPRVGQSLAGAGIASLYASILVAVNLYGLIGPVPAFVGMAGVTALAMALSLRFGAPSALLGLVGGLAAPALVGAGQPDVPLLTLYLAFAVGGLSTLSRTQRWAWLGIGALIGGLGWGAVLLLGGALDAASTVSIGLYVLLVGIAFPLLAPSGAGATLVRFAGSVAAVAQMAALVATGGFALLHWGLFGLISVAILWLSRREEGFRHLPLIGLGMALLLLGAWTDPAPAHFALVLLTTAALYGLPALLALWRPAGGLAEAGQIAGLALAASLLTAMHFYRAEGSADLALAAVALAAACLPAVAALLGWGRPERSGDARFALLSSTAALLLAVAAGFAAPAWLLPLLVGGLAVSLLLLSLLAEDERLEYSGWGFAAASAALLAAAPSFGVECERLVGLAGQEKSGLAVLRWAGLSCAAAVFAWRARLDVGRHAAQAAAALLAYGAAAQLAPALVLPLLAAAGLPALAAAGRARAPMTLLPAMTVLLGVSVGWAALPMLHWADAVLPALAGDPVLANELPGTREALLRLLGPAALIGAARWIGGAQAGVGERRVASLVAASLGAVAGHIVFKQLFGIESQAMFILQGLAERTLWEAVLVTAGVAAWKLGSRRAALALGLAALAHFGAFSLLLHNPLWAEQAVGTLPVLNLLLPSYGLALALLWSAGRFELELSAPVERPRVLLQMVLIVLLAFSLLRQLAEGTILSGPGLSQEEDIARSILAVLLAIGFLLWGIRMSARDWRIGSLVLMLGAVAKVFLLDASGLEGLMRIASFAALGISLIGIGWLYSRALGGVRPSSSLR
jgi:uncharacterized membrane protein